MDEGAPEIRLGAARVVALTDCAPAAADCGYSFPDAVLAAEPRAARWFAGGRFETRFGPFLLRRAAGDVLVDCGLGPGPEPYFPGLAGALPAALAAAGSGMERIAAVVFTHLHIDHVGWAPFLPNARFVVAAAEWAHWARGEGLAHHVRAVARCIAPLAEAGRLELVEAGEVLPTEVLAGVTLLAAPGHTPGHHAVLVEDRLLIAGDTWHSPAQIEMPAWCHRADMDPKLAVATRTRLADMARRHGWLVAAGHFTAANAFGRVGEGGFEPLRPDRR